MSILTSECTRKRTLCSPCKLNVFGYVSGWLGITWRIVLIVLLSTITSNITDYDPSIYTVFLATCLSYIVTSALINCAFIYGIYMKKRYYMVPYIALVAIELILSVIILSGIIMLFFAASAVVLAIYTICLSALMIGINFILWLYSILLYNDFQYDAMAIRGEVDNIALTRMYSVNSHT